MVKKNTQLSLLGAALTLVLGFGVAQAELNIPGNTYTVTTTNDALVGCTGTAPNFTCSTLRDAISAANNDAANGAANDRIKFSPSIAGGTIKLGSTLVISPNYSLRLTIDGTGANLTINGRGLVQVLELDCTPTPHCGDVVTLNALTISNGSGQGGGAIFVNEETTATIALFVVNSTFSGNSSTAGGGGAIFAYSPVTITNSTFYKNNSLSGPGGAIRMTFNGDIQMSQGPTLTVTNSTFSSNTSSVPGSIIEVDSGFSGDHEVESEFSDNQLAVTATLSNTILAAEIPTTPNAPAGPINNGNCAAAGRGSFIDGGGNLSDDPINTCNFNLLQGTSFYNVPDTTSGEFAGMNLGTLASNSGPTQTVALLPGSAAINSGVVGLCPATDQRVAARPVGGESPSCSSGAFQFGTVQTSGSGTATGCLANCNITGGDTQTITGTPAALAAIAALGSAGNIVENVCIVNSDPRQICGGTNPAARYYSSTTLPVAAVCPNTQFNPGFGSTLIPDYFCGNYGPGGAGTGNGFAVIQGIADGVNGIPGLLQFNEVEPDKFFNVTPSPGECSNTGVSVDNISFGWGTWSLSPVEGFLPERSWSSVDGNVLEPAMIDLTDGCGGQKGKTSGMSLTLTGVTLNLANATQELGRSAATNPPATNLVGFAEFKYANLLAEVATDSIDTANKVKLLAIITQSGLFLIAGKHGCAEDTLYEADRYVINNASHFHGVPARDPNSYGRTRMRVLNLFYTLFTRLDGQPNPVTGDPLLASNPLDSNLTSPPATCSVSYLGPDGY